MSRVKVESKTVSETLKDTYQVSETSVLVQFWRS
jgi:hypothetical protein